MAKHLVVVADAARASLYGFDDEHNPSSTRPPHLEEKAALVNPALRMRQSERYTDSRPGLRGGVNGKEGHAVDDRRDSQEQVEIDRFAQSVVESAREWAGELDVERIVMAAPPAMLGVLRTRASGLNDWPVEEVRKDLTKLTPHQLHQHLAAAEILPEPRRLGLE